MIPSLIVNIHTREVHFSQLVLPFLRIPLLPLLQYSKSLFIPNLIHLISLVLLMANSSFFNKFLNILAFQNE